MKCLRDNISEKKEIIVEYKKQCYKEELKFENRGNNVDEGKKEIFHKRGEFKAE